MNVVVVFLAVAVPLDACAVDGVGHSFPARRSSDLAARIGRGGEGRTGGVGVGEIDVGEGHRAAAGQVAVLDGVLGGQGTGVNSSHGGFSDAGDGVGENMGVGAAAVVGDVVGVGFDECSVRG